MIYDEDPFRRRPRKSTARRKARERYAWMTRETTKWPSTRWPITKIMSSDGCKGDTDGIPRLTTDDYRQTVFDMKAGRLPLVRNDGNWGLGDCDLAETTPCAPAMLAHEGE